MNKYLISIFFDYFVPLQKDFASGVAKCPPTGLWRFACRRTSSKNRIVGSGGKEMRVRMFYPLKINDYGNQED